MPADDPGLFLAQSVPFDREVLLFCIFDEKIVDPGFLILFERIKIKSYRLPVFPVNEYEEPAQHNLFHLIRTDKFP